MMIKIKFQFNFIYGHWWLYMFKVLNQCTGSTLHLLSEDINKKHGEAMDTQMKFNEANNKSLQRLTDRDNESNKKIEIMIGNMHDCLSQGGYGERPMSLKTPDRKRIPLTALDKARYRKIICLPYDYKHMSLFLVEHSN